MLFHREIIAGLVIWKHSEVSCRRPLNQQKSAFDRSIEEGRLFREDVGLDLNEKLEETERPKVREKVRLK